MKYFTNHVITDETGKSERYDVYDEHAHNIQLQSVDNKVSDFSCPDGFALEGGCIVDNYFLFYYWKVDDTYGSLYSMSLSDYSISKIGDNFEFNHGNDFSYDGSDYVYVATGTTTLYKLYKNSYKIAETIECPVQCWEVAIGENGIIYISNTLGIYSYDGSNFTEITDTWEVQGLPSGVIIQNMFYYDNKLFALYYNASTIGVQNGYYYYSVFNVVTSERYVLFIPSPFGLALEPESSDIEKNTNFVYTIGGQNRLFISKSLPVQYANNNQYLNPGRVIPPDSDFNDYITPGQYCVLNSSDIKTMKNAPTPSNILSGGTLFVFTTGAGNVAQFYVNNYRNQLYARSGNFLYGSSDIFTDSKWYLFASIPEATVYDFPGYITSTCTGISCAIGNTALSAYIYTKLTSSSYKITIRGVGGYIIQNVNSGLNFSYSDGGLYITKTDNGQFNPNAVNNSPVFIHFEF